MSPRQTDRPQDEVQWITRIASGDRAAFEALYDLYQPRLRRFAMRLLQGNKLAFDRVDEVVTDTMVVVWRQSNRYRGEARVSTWIFGIAYRIALKKLRRKGPPLEEMTSEILGTLSGSENPEDSLSRKERREQMQRSLSRLSPAHRAVLELTFFEGRSYREIADIVDCPVNTVKTRMFHARKQLRAILDASESKYPEPRGSEMRPRHQEIEPESTEK